ncbi:MAG: metallophosphoesterase family protein [Pirellulales bacterium]
MVASSARPLFFTTALLALFAGVATASAAETEPPLTRGPYLQLGTTQSMAIVWRTLGPTKPTVHYGTAPDKLDQIVGAAEITSRVSAEVPPANQIATEKALPLHSAPAGTWQYEAGLHNLAKDTKYYYAVFDGARKLAGGDEEHYFHTHPEPGPKKAFRFWVVGDSGTGDDTQRAVYDAMRSYVKIEGQRPLDLYLHVGDMAYPKGTDDEFQRKFFDIYQPTLRNTVCWAAMGNHEGYTSKGTTGIGPYYDAYVCPKRAEAGGLPSTTEAFYSFDYANVHFICLDSHDLDRSPAGVMATWLRADLERTKADWIVAFFHHPPYTKGSHDSDKEGSLIEMREQIMPILEAGGVDLVLTGHSHIYERSMLIDGAYHTPTIAQGVVLDDGDGSPEGEGPYRKSAGIHPHEGAVQVVTGHGGAKLSRKGSSPVMKVVVTEHGSTLIDVDGDTLTGTMVNRYAVRRDLFQIVKRGTVTPQIVSNPRQLPPFKLPTKFTKVDAKGEPILPPGAQPMIERHAEWEYLAGGHPQGEAWKLPDFMPAKPWATGQAGFGYGDDDDVTELKTMRNKFSVVYARHEFELDGGEKEQIADLGIAINYDDGFIAYLNGHEVLRVGVAEGSGEKAKKITSHNPKGYEYFSLTDAIKYLDVDHNVLAVEGHNNSLGSSDFSLDPYLVAVKKPAGAKSDDKGKK